MKAFIFESSKIVGKFFDNSPFFRLEQLVGDNSLVSHQMVSCSDGKVKSDQTWTKFLIESVEKNPCVQKKKKIRNKTINCEWIKRKKENIGCGKKSSREVWVSGDWEWKT